MKNLINLLLSLIYKENCCVCGSSYDNLPVCKSCLKTVENLSGFAQRKIEGVEIYSAAVYRGVLKDIIHKFKFNHKKQLVNVLADILNNYYKNCEKLKSYQNVVVVPVPTSKNNIKERGYNNVYEIARKFASLQRFKFNPNILLKTKNTIPQFKLRKNQRDKNVYGAFRVNIKEYTLGATILIVDDIITTGATLEEIIKTFKKEGIENMVCLTCAKAV